MTNAPGGRSAQGASGARSEPESSEASEVNREDFDARASEQCVFGKSVRYSKI